MKAKRGRYQIDQRRLVADLAFTEKLRRRDVSTTAMRLDAAPVVDALENVLAIFTDFQLDHHQPAIMTQREQIDWPRAVWPAMRSAKLGMQRSDDQSRIELRNIAPQN